MSNEQLNQYHEKLKHFDWQYDFSDDHRVFQAGYLEQRRLYAEAVSLGSEAIDLYFMFVNRRLD